MTLSAKRFALLGITALTLLCVGHSRVQAAPTLDLTTKGSSGFVNGAYFEWADASSTGSGVVDAFVRIDTNNKVVRGYNTDGVVEFDTKDDTHTHSLLLSAVPVVDKGGVLYREFLLDINQAGGRKSKLSLDTIEIYLASAGDLTGHPTLGTKIFGLDPAGADAWILLDGSLNKAGSGSGDMFAYIPNTLFTGGDYVYLYSQFGASEGSAYPNTAGFEEWAVRTDVVPPPPPPPTVPVPGALLLAAAGIQAVAWRNRRGLA
ncbi:MAG: hypothetical protein KBE04_00660 [Phycisphaerae bacterium]|nr:hypothetical protein [Phycisphaerae bacterium]